MSRTVRVPAARVVRWFENFSTRHGEVSCTVEDGCLVAVAADGAVASARLPFGREYGGPPDPAWFAEAVAQPVLWVLWKIVPTTPPGDAFKLAVFIGILVVVGQMSRRGLLPRTRPIVPGEWAISD